MSVTPTWQSPSFIKIFHFSPFTFHLNIVSLQPEKKQVVNYCK